jgi:hypothetical protein
MSKMKWMPLPLLTVLIATIGTAEPVRTFYSLENQLPRWEQLEVGVDFEASELEVGPFDIDYMETSIYARYGLLDDLAVQIDIPFAQFDPGIGDSESGIGDVELEFQLRAYEDIFGYPYFIPYVNVALPTGDDDKGLGTGDTVVTGGIAYGSTIHDWIDWVLDVSYQINSDEDNQIKVGHSYVWNVSEEFAILTELYYEQASIDELDDDFIIAGGFSYNWSLNLEMALSVGAGVEGPTDVKGNARIAYSF